jgi:hypothetical protein
VNDEVPRAEDAERIAAEARRQIAEQAAELRKVRIPISTEPPTTFRP